LTDYTGTLLKKLSHHQKTRKIHRTLSTPLKKEIVRRVKLWAITGASEHLQSELLENVSGLKDSLNNGLVRTNLRVKALYADTRVHYITFSHTDPIHGSIGTLHPDTISETIVSR
jgi:hypothetical protein